MVTKRKLWIFLDSSNTVYGKINARMYNYTCMLLVFFFLLVQATKSEQGYLIKTDIYEECFIWEAFGLCASLLSIASGLSLMSLTALIVKYVFTSELSSRPHK